MVADAALRRNRARRFDQGPHRVDTSGARRLIWIAAERRWILLLRMNLVRGAIVVLVLAGDGLRR